MSYFLAGDGPFFFEEQIRQISWFPQIWFPEFGFGDNALSRLWLDYPFRLFVKILSVLGLSWWSIEKILWGIVIALSIYSAYSLSKLFVSGRIWNSISAMIYATNTYALLLFGGGQLGVALGYAFAPLVLLNFFETIKDFSPAHPKFSGRTIGAIIINSIYFAILIMFDLRLAYLVMAAVVMYFGIYITGLERRQFSLRNILYKVFNTLLAPICIITLLHLYWILPMVFGGTLGLSEQITSPGMLKFLSVADFSHAISLLHPNWPENLFGKVYLLQPEFLVLPILAFSSLWVSRRNRKERTGDMMFVEYFSLLSLIGIFFAKGVQEPFGGIYDWCFSRIPGFIMFRDPTKFYLYVALGYSLLIPYSLQQLSQLSKRVPFMDNFIRRKTFITYIISILFVLFWFVTIRELPSGVLTGNFSPKDVPIEYIKFKDLLIDDGSRSRVLWLPAPDKFKFSSHTHPVLSARDQFPVSTHAEFLNLIGSSKFSETISDMGVKYIVVPMDHEKNIFMEQYKHNPRLREQFIMQLSLRGFKRLPEFQNLAIFVNPKFSYKSDIPKQIQILEELSRYGLTLSATVLGICIVVLFMKKRK